MRRERLVRGLELLTLGLIVYTLVTLPFETLPDLAPATHRFLAWSEATVTAVFTLEYLLRAALARRPLQYVLSPLGVIDLVAILPFYLATGLDLRALRAVRLFRIFRILKLARFNSALDLYLQAMRAIREELLVFLLAALVLIYLAAVGIYYFEFPVQPDRFPSIVHSLWWAVATLTTVGYGDVYPVTAGGKIFTSLILVVGLGVVAIPTGLFASAIVQASQRRGRAPGADD